MQDLKGKVAVVTGASSGIGRALAQQLAERGAHLALCDVRSIPLETLKGELAARNVRVLTRVVDVAKRDQLEDFAKAVEAELGPAHIVINNAGVSVTHFVSETEVQDMEWIMNINFWGVVHGSRVFLPQLRRHDDARLINISSIFGIIALPTQAFYNASKFAVRGFTEALRQELEDSQVKVTCVHPGGVKTNIVRFSRTYADPNGQATDIDTASDRFQKMAMTTPEDAARQIINQGVVQGRPRVMVGLDAKLLDIMQRFLPVSYTRLVQTVLKIDGKRLRRAAAKRAASETPDPAVAAETSTGKKTNQA